MSELQWNAARYVPTSIVQLNLAKAVLEKYSLIKPTDYVLDLGCGPGKITADLAAMLPQGKILGIDASASMIDFAKNNYTTIRNLSFENMDAQHIDYKNRFDGVVSFSVLHWIKDQVRTLKNVSNALKAGGYFFGHLFPYVSYVHVPLELTMQKSKWKPYFAEFSQDYYYHDVNGYKILLEQAGFKVEDIAAPLLQLEWDRELFIKTQSSWLPHLAYIPENLKLSFLNDLADEFERFHPKLENGKYLGPLRIIIFLAKKS